MILSLNHDLLNFSASSFMSLESWSDSDEKALIMTNNSVAQKQGVVC